MTPKEIEELLDRDPFEPFCVHTSGGKRYEVTDPHMAIPTQTRLFIVYQREGWTDIVLRHITSIQSLAAA